MAETKITYTRLITIRQAAERIGVSRTKIYELIQDGTLPRTKVLPVRIPLEEVLRYINEIAEKE